MNVFLNKKQKLQNTRTFTAKDVLKSTFSSGNFDGLSTDVKN